MLQVPLFLFLVATFGHRGSVADAGGMLAIYQTVAMGYSIGPWCFYYLTSGLELWMWITDFTGAQLKLPFGYTITVRFSSYSETSE